jgi:L-lactate dehydrogenase complex protein LldG
LISRNAIVGALEDAHDILHRRFGTNFPRSVNFISGASRTGDIGGRIVHGAHGPRRLIVAIC